MKTNVPVLLVVILGLLAVFLVLKVAFTILNLIFTLAVLAGIAFWLKRIFRKRRP